MRDIRNKVETINGQGQKTVYGEVQLSKDTEFTSCYDGRGCKSETITVPAGTWVSYTYSETHSGNYHIVRTWKNERRYESSVVKEERSFTGSSGLEAPAESLYEAAKKLTKGDIIEIGDRTCYPNNTGNRLEEPVLEVRSMMVSRVDPDTEHGVSVVYIPCDRPNTVRCGFGSTHFAQSGPKPYGPQWLRVVGHKQLHDGRLGLRPIWNPRPGDTGYDLMC